MTTAENNVAAQAGDEPMPCPFCGGAPQVDEEHDDRGNRVIECAGCGANVGANMLSAGWRRWNQRVLSPRATADVERDKVLEEAAAVCDDKHHTWRWDNEEDSNSGPRDCAAGIRALKSVATTKPGA